MKQPSDLCLHARMPDVSCLCVMSGSWALNGDDDIFQHFVNMQCNNVQIFETCFHVFLESQTKFLFLRKPARRRVMKRC